MRPENYRTATVTELLGAPLIKTRTPTLPAAVPAGIFTLICHRPIYPGAKPEYWTSPNAAPMATHMEGCEVTHVVPFDVGIATVVASGLEGAAVPSNTGGLTCPCPVP